MNNDETVLPGQMRIVERPFATPGPRGDLVWYIIAVVPVIVHEPAHRIVEVDEDDTIDQWSVYCACVRPGVQRPSFHWFYVRDFNCTTVIT